MTNQEALDYIRKHRDRCLAYDLAIDALDKRTPKPLRETISTLRCPSCGRHITNKGCTRPVSYCPNCGQAISFIKETLLRFADNETVDSLLMSAT